VPKTFFAVIAAAVRSFGASAALAQMAEPAQIADTSKGKALVNAREMTLYTLDRDNVVGISTC
jgi:predicted lipoprotein with Yx(FWY)xxD motif